MKKIVIIALGVTALVVLAVGAYFWYNMVKPLYQPSMVREEANLSAPLAPPAQSASEAFWKVEADIELWHFAQGQGKNVLIVHGGPGYPYTNLWAGLEPLSTEYRFHYYDQRGCGKSTRPFDRFELSNYYENMTSLEQKLGIGAQVADIERIRRILGEEKLILIGHSWGGFLASLYAAEFPERVEALILVSPANTLVMPQPDADSDLFASLSLRLPESERPAFDAFMEEYLDFSTLFEKSEADLVGLNQEFGRFYAMVSQQAAPEQGDPGGWMVWAMYVSMGTRHDYRPALRNVTAPVLVLHGANDLQSEAASRIYADAFPNARFAVIPDSSHFSFEEQPDTFADVISAFLSEIN